MNGLVLLSLSVIGTITLIHFCVTVKMSQDVQALTRRRDLQRIQDLADLLQQIRNRRGLLPMLMLAPVYSFLVQEGSRWIGM